MDCFGVLKRTVVVVLKRTYDFSEKYRYFLRTEADEKDVPRARDYKIKFPKNDNLSNLTILQHVKCTCRNLHS